MNLDSHSFVSRALWSKQTTNSPRNGKRTTSCNPDVSSSAPVITCMQESKVALQAKHQNDVPWRSVCAPSSPCASWVD